MGLFDLIKGVWDLTIKPAPTPPKPPVTPQPDITTLTQDIEPQPKSQDEIKNEGLLKIRQKVLQQYSQWQERGQLRTQTNIEQYDILKSPQPFWKLRSGESYEVRTCTHVACEGTGTFEVSQAQLDHYKAKNYKPPKSCYACRVWAHEHNLEGKVVGTCEVCQKPVTVSPRKWIGRHKFQGQPEFGMYCGNCKRMTQQRENFPADYPQNRTGYLVRIRSHKNYYEKFVNIRTHHPINFDRAFDKLRVYKGGVVLSRYQLLSLVGLTEVVGNHFYHTAQTRGKGGVTQSWFEHIAQHFNGVKDKTLARIFPDVLSVIRYAHDIAVIDHSNFLGVWQGHDLIKCDTTNGIKFVFGINKDRQYYLKTAYGYEKIQLDMTEYDIQKLSAGFLLTTFDDDRNT